MNINRPCGTFDRTYFQAKELYRTPLRKTLLGLFIILMYVLPLLTGDYGISILTLICAFTIGMLGLQIITGYCGQISIGHAAFMGIGMYTVAIMQRHFGFSFWFCLPLAGLVPMLIGMLFGVPALRIKGLYLAFATLAAQAGGSHAHTWLGYTDQGTFAASGSYVGILTAGSEHYGTVVRIYHR